MENFVEIIQDIHKQTVESRIEWTGTSSDSCFHTNYEGRGIIICKYYPRDSEDLVSSISYLDDDGLLSDESYQWSEGDAEFSELAKLYDFLAKNFYEQYEV